jgi:hypothetical protein
MTSIFDGLGGLINSVFGSNVTLFYAALPSVTVQGIFRDMPVTFQTADGREMTIVSPSLRLSRASASLLKPRDKVLLPDGRQFFVTQVHRSYNPAADALWYVELEAKT